MKYQRRIKELRRLRRNLIKMGIIELLSFVRRLDELDIEGIEEIKKEIERRIKKKRGVNNMVNLDYTDIAEELNYYLNDPELEDKILVALREKEEENNN